MRLSFADIIPWDSFLLSGTTTNRKRSPQLAVWTKHLYLQSSQGCRRLRDANPSYYSLVILESFWILITRTTCSMSPWYCNRAAKHQSRGTSPQIWWISRFPASISLPYSFVSGTTKINSLRCWINRLYHWINRFWYKIDSLCYRIHIPGYWINR